jgi:hypothetical protein
VADLLPCPFCGETPDVSGNYTFVETDGPKWGAVRCCGTGPEVRTGYGPVDDWRDDAIAAWNERKAPPSTESGSAEVLMELREFVINHSEPNAVLDGSVEWEHVIGAGEVTNKIDAMLKAASRGEGT